MFPYVFVEEPGGWQGSPGGESAPGYMFILCTNYNFQLFFQIIFTNGICRSTFFKFKKFYIIKNIFYNEFSYINLVLSIKKNFYLLMVNFIDAWLISTILMDNRYRSGMEYDELTSNIPLDRRTGYVYMWHNIWQGDISKWTGTRWWSCLPFTII
jgi:hypothetical protein